MGKDESIQDLALRLELRDFVSLAPPHALLVFWPQTGAASVLGFRTTALDTKSLKRVYDARARKEFDVAALVKAPDSPYNERVSVGRARNCDIVIRDSSISKLHAHFRVDAAAGTIALTDVGSHNGTMVDGTLLVAQQPCLVHKGSLIQFGSVRAELVDARALHAALR